MKLKHALMLAASAVLSAVAFLACNCDGNSCSDDASSKDAAKVKPLVVYWTWSDTHNTKVVAEMLQQKTGADIALIEMVTPYPNDFGGAAQAGQRDLSARSSSPMTSRARPSRSSARTDRATRPRSSISPTRRPPSPRSTSSPKSSRTRARKPRTPVPPLMHGSRRSPRSKPDLFRT